MSSLNHNRKASKVFVEKWVFQVIGYLYLMLPFIIFCFGWYKLLVSLATLVILVWIFIRILFDMKSKGQVVCSNDSMLWLAISVLGIWVLFSGIGGFAFQNHDFHWRNAIFRDLIEMRWPVIYFDSGNIPMELVYYIGFWLPSAVVGKAFGWFSANIFLFFWTLLGVVIVARLVAIRLDTGLFPTCLFIIFFSGMDTLGVVLFQSWIKGIYPSLWPPYQHLEWWAHGMQYSSFTTQLFWVFNQAVPSWVCISLLLNSGQNRYAFLLWSLCLFFAPLPALGLIPFIAIEAILPIVHVFKRRYMNVSTNLSTVLSGLSLQLRDILSVENIVGGGIVFILTFQYFKSNQTATLFSFVGNPPVNLPIGIVFFFVECGLVWVLLIYEHKKDIFWYLVGIMLAVFPFIHIGYYSDFTMRASIPALFYLMFWSADIILRENMFRKPRPTRIILLICLLIGAITPICEINRSLYRTASFYICPRVIIPFICAAGEWKRTDIRIDIDKSYFPERDHPGSLVADDLVTLSKLNLAVPTNFISKLTPSFLNRLISRMNYR